MTTTPNPAPVTTSAEDASEIDPALQKLIDSAPAHIWLDLGEETHLVDEGTTFRDLAGVTWSEDNATGVGIKYVRAPAAVTTSDAERDLAEIYDAFRIGAAARSFHILRENLCNVLRREQCLAAIERTFFMVATEPQEEDGGEPGEECLLNWGQDPAQYVETFRQALKAIQANEQTAWQPIATAPKNVEFRDGRHAYCEKILVFAGEVLRARWWQHADGSSNFLQDGGRQCYPTHWMPLPAAPQSEEGSLFLGVADGDAVGGKSGGAA